MKNIKVNGLKNLRSLGGYQTDDGKQIKPRMIFRSECLDKLDKEAEKYLFNELNIRTVIDLRTDAEEKEAKNVIIPGVEYKHIPIFNESMYGISREKEFDLMEVIKNSVPMAELYKRVVTTDEYLKNVETVLKIIMEKVKEGGVLYHCSAGKDRTGLISLFILTMLNVPTETINKDYLYTNTVFGWKLYLVAPVMAIKLKSIRLGKVSKEMVLADQKYLDTAKEAILEKYDSILDFIKQKLNITQEEIDEFKANVLE
ncbi:MAG: tyrosine-protein phosphatase [Clostridia bacterium]|nr:tyrosine-protein phosphatase [Clostridia bacterium]